MARKHWAAIILITLVTTTLFLIWSQAAPAATATPDVYVGIDAAYDNETLTSLINQVSAYTNLFIIGCTSITENQTKLDNTCQYLYDRGLSFIVYQDVPVGVYDSVNLSTNRTRPLNSTNAPFPQRTGNFSEQTPPTTFTSPYGVSRVSNWTQTAKERWGPKFLGIYYVDEVAGRQLDLASGWVEVQNATDYVDAANQFNRTVSRSVQWFRDGYSDGQTLNVFSSDYALYQFDYNAGYDVILAQLGWNYSRQLSIALCRGAATAANKDWGAIITWEYNQAPYLESGSRLYDDMVLAYENGAKYIAIFDSNKEYTQSVLTADQLNAIQEFWQYALEHPRNQSSSSDRVAFVLPEAYGYGFRGPSDSIWGLWPADAYSTNLSIAVGEKLLEYGESLDIVYNQIQLPSAGYRQLIYAEEINPLTT
jgi:hypothetical protein